MISVLGKTEHRMMLEEIEQMKLEVECKLLGHEGQYYFAPIYDKWRCQRCGGEQARLRHGEEVARLQRELSDIK